MKIKIDRTKSDPQFFRIKITFTWRGEGFEEATHKGISGPKARPFRPNKTAVRVMGPAI